MTTQIQVRGAITATQAARTLASREFDIDTTLKRINIHDGSRAGGIPHLNYNDAVAQTFTAATATGTNSIVVALAIAPAAYAAKQKFGFIAANTITGSSTLNVNTLGAKTIMKVVSGVLVALAAGDIVAGMYYECVYDGTNMLLLIGGSSGSLVFLGSQTAAAGSSIDFTGLISSSFDVYEFDIEEIYGSAVSNLLMLTSTNGGSSYDTAGSDYKTAGYIADSSPAITAKGLAAAGEIILATHIETAIARAAAGRVTLFNPVGTTSNKKIISEIACFDATGPLFKAEVTHAERNTTADIDAVRFMKSSGTISGTIRMFGRKNA